MGFGVSSITTRLCRSLQNLSHPVDSLDGAAEVSIRTILFRQEFLREKHIRSTVKALLLRLEWGTVPISKTAPMHYGDWIRCGPNFDSLRETTPTKNVQCRRQRPSVCSYCIANHKGRKITCPLAAVARVVTRQPGPQVATLTIHL